MPPFSAHGLGDEGPRRLLGKHHPGGMELDELHVLQAAAGFGCEAHGVAGVLVAPRGGAPPDARVATRGEDDRVRHDQQAAAVVDVEAVRAEDAALVHEQARDVDVVADLDAELRGPPAEGQLDLAAGVVAREARPAPAVRAEEALGQPAVVSRAQDSLPSARDRRSPAAPPDRGSRRSPGRRASSPRAACPPRAAPSCPRDPSSRARR